MTAGARENGSVFTPGDGCRLSGHLAQISAMTSLNGLAPLKASLVSPMIVVERQLMFR